jgi:hypothetical protein
MTPDLVIIENLLRIIAGTLIWIFISQTLLLGAIWVRLKRLTPLGKEGNNNCKNESDTIKDRIKSD